MKYFVIFLIIFASLTIPNASALCVVESLEWWEPCNDEGQNDVLSFKATMIIVVSAIIGIVIIFLVVRKRKNKNED